MTRQVGKPKFPGVVAGAALTFTTTIIGDEVRCAAGTFLVVQKSACERYLDLVPSHHPTHAYPTRVSEFEYNRGGYTLVTPASA